MSKNHFINASGVLAGSGPRGAFVSDQDVNYVSLGNNNAAQKTLYVVPIYDSSPSHKDNNTKFFPTTAIIINAIEGAIRDLEKTGVICAEQFFFDNCVHFCQVTKRVGHGDLFLNLHVGYDFTEEIWAQLILGAVFPTGARIKDAGQLFAQTTGNNGHFEVKGGLQAGWEPNTWFALHADASYNHVFDATEWRAAAFKGATVKNIGPTTEAKVGWGYFTGHIDVTVFHSENQNLGFSAGYEAYVKRSDKVNFCLSAVKEFELRSDCGLGSVQNFDEKELDACILQKDTKRISHKIRFEVFHRWDYCELFAGASRVVAGKNIMKESEAHIGCGIYW